MMGLKYLGCFGHYLYQSVHSVYLSVTTIIYLSDITQTITEYIGKIAWELWVSYEYK